MKPIEDPQRRYAMALLVTERNPETIPALETYVESLSVRQLHKNAERKGRAQIRITWPNGLPVGPNNN